MITLTGVLDANAVIGLSHGRVFDQLCSLYSPLYIPPAVVQEVITQGSGLAGAEELRRALGIWVIETAPSLQSIQPFATLRSEADREVLAVAHERGADHILTSDAQLARLASRHRLTCLPATLVVVLLKEHRLVNEVGPVLDRMRSRGFGIDGPAYERALRAAGEWPPA